MCIWWKKPRLCRLLPGVAHYCSGTPGPRWPHARWLSRGRVASCAHVSYSTGRVSARAVSRAPRPRPRPRRIRNRGAGAVARLVNLCSRWQPSPPLVRPGVGIEATSGPPDCSALQRSTVRRLGVHSRLEKWFSGLCRRSHACWVLIHRTTIFCVRSATETNVGWRTTASWCPRGDPVSLSLRQLQPGARSSGRPPVGAVSADYGNGK